MSSDYSLAEWHPSPNFWAGRAGSKVDGIILHGTAGGDGPGVASYLSQPATGASVHFVIGQDGHVFQLVGLANSAWGNGIPNKPSWPVLTELAPTNPNRYTVSIEHAKASTDNSDALTAAQLASSLALVNWLLTALETLGLASSAFVQRRDAGDLPLIVTGHFAIDSVDRARCPGTFDWSGYYTRLMALRGTTSEGDAMTDDDRKWVARGIVYLGLALGRHEGPASPNIGAEIEKLVPPILTDMEGGVSNLIGNVLMPDGAYVWNALSYALGEITTLQAEVAALKGGVAPTAAKPSS